MQPAIAPRGDARTFLTHFVGGGLEDDLTVTIEQLADSAAKPVPAQAEVGFESSETEFDSGTTWSCCSVDC